VNVREVTITKLDHMGQPVASYAAARVYADDEQVVLRAVWRHRPWREGALTLDTGGILMERYYPGRWFNVMDLYSPTGVLLGWYCNITRPAEVSAAAIRWSDLALDLLVLPGGAAQELDRDEFAALALSDAERHAAEETLAMLQAWVREGRPPFRHQAPEARTGT